MIKHFRIYVTGRVQGVFYRKYTVEKAMQLGLSGEVKNMRDGSVYIEAEGDEESLKFLVDWCNTGSPMADVDDVVVEEAPVKGFTTFCTTR